MGSLLLQKRERETRRARRKAQRNAMSYVNKDGEFSGISRLEIMRKILKGTQKENWWEWVRGVVA